MANKPLVTCTVKITAKDINGNNIAKQFNQVNFVNLDYTDATINIQDVTGSFYFAIGPLTTVTYTVTPASGGVLALHAIVMS